MTTIKQQIQSEARALLQFEPRTMTERERRADRRGTVIHIGMEFFVPDEARRAGWNDIPLHDVVSTACDDLYMRLTAILKQQVPKVFEPD